MIIATNVHVGAQIEGLHHWPDADGPDNYLRHPHRHLFIVEARIEVLHDDREIEINAAARWLNNLLPTLATTSPMATGPVDFGAQSCEQLAHRITEAITEKYGARRRIHTRVLEDGLLGASVTWHPDMASEPGS